jgi:hypothetical protein
MNLEISAVVTSLNMTKHERVTWLCLNLENERTAYHPEVAAINNLNLIGARLLWEVCKTLGRDDLPVSHSFLRTFALADEALRPKAKVIDLQKVSALAA